MFALLPCYLYIYLFTGYSSSTEKMKFQIMILAVALVTISGPAAAKDYKACELAKVLTECGLNFNVSDCKYTTATRMISIKVKLNKIYFAVMDLIPFCSREKSRRNGNLRSVKTYVFLGSGNMSN